MTLHAADHVKKFSKATVKGVRLSAIRKAGDVLDLEVTLDLTWGWCLWPMSIPLGNTALFRSLTWSLTLPGSVLRESP